MVQRLSLCLALSFLWACHDELGPQAIDGSVVNPDSTAVVIVNEGNFQWGNASIGQFKPSENSYTDGLYRSANDQALGDVLQEAHRFGDQHFLVMNGSNELLICDASWREESRISMAGAPHRLWFWENSLWITDLFSREIRQLDYQGQKIQSWQSKQSSIEICVWQDRLLFVQEGGIEALNSSRDSLFELLSTSRKIQDVLSMNNHLYLLYQNGDLEYWEHPDSSRQLLENHPLSGQSLIVNHDAQSFYSYDGSEIRWHKLASNFRGESWLKLETQNFYGLSLDPSGESLWLFDAQNFVAPHRVLQIDLATKSILHDFEAGALPKGLERIW